MAFLTAGLRWCVESQWVGSVLKQCEQHDCECDALSDAPPPLDRLLRGLQVAAAAVRRYGRATSASWTTFSRLIPR